MPVTLAEAALNTQDDVDRLVIDEFRKQSTLLDSLLFHDTVNPMGGGSTLTYGYHRVITERAAAFRAINAEYTPAEAAKDRFTVDLRPLGGAFQIDRVLSDLARGAETAFQLEQLAKATRTKFTDELVNGDTAVDPNGFDGLDAALTGTSTCAVVIAVPVMPPQAGAPLPVSTATMKRDTPTGDVMFTRNPVVAAVTCVSAGASPRWMLREYSQNTT